MTKTEQARKWTQKPFSLNLIEESSLAYLLYVAFIDQKIAPGVYMGLRTQNDIIPEGERAFMNACLKKALEEGDTAVKVRNFSNKTNKE